MEVSPTISSFRLSTMSASAPAPNANKNIGTVEAAWTNETTKGSAFRVVINQPEAALYIQVPMLETTVAVQITVNALWRNALQGLRGDSPAGVETDFSSVRDGSIHRPLANASTRAARQ